MVPEVEKGAMFPVLDPSWSMQVPATAVPILDAQFTKLDFKQLLP